MRRYGFLPHGPIALYVTVLVLVLLSRSINPHWMFGGDTANEYMLYLHQVSAFARGEYPEWNPLVRAGEREPVFHSMLWANPIVAGTAWLSATVGMRDMVFSMCLATAAMVAAYVWGCFRLVTEWSGGNRWAGLTAAAVAGGSSPVFDAWFNIELLFIVVPMPWLLLGAWGLLRRGSLRYGLMAVAALPLFFYAYQFVLGTLFLLLLIGLAALPWFRAEPLAAVWRRVAALPRWRLMGLLALALVFFAPVLALMVEFGEQLAHSRLGSYWVDDGMAIQSTTTNVLTAADFLHRPKFWALTFSGAVFQYEGELRFMVGAAVPALAGALLIAGGARRRLGLLMTLAGLAAMGTNQLPLSLVFNIFPFSLIHNAGFIYQFGFFAMAVVAGLAVADLDGARMRIWLYRLALLEMLVLALLLAAQFVLSPPEREFNVAVIAAGLVLMAVMAIGATRIAPPKLLAMSAMAVAVYGLVTTKIHFHRSIGGEIADAAVAERWRYRDDHRLVFRDRRPDAVEVLDGAGLSWIGKTGESEFSSLLTLTDNSYGTLPGAPLSRFPFERSWVRLSAVPGFESLLGPKFHLFDRVFVSDGLQGLAELRRHPGLLAAMVGAGIGLVEGEKVSPPATLGPFSATAAQAAIGMKATGSQLEVAVGEYRSNRIELSATLDRAGVLAYSDRWDQGWTVEVDGRPAPLLRVYHDIKGVALEAGRHQVTFIYAGLSQRLIWLMQAGFLAAVLGLAVTGRRGRS